MVVTDDKKEEHAQKHLTTAISMSRDMDMRCRLEKADADRDT
jgi:hypothetical protein